MSFKNYKRSIILDFNYEEVRKGVPEANKQMALLNAEFRKQSEAARQSGDSIEKLQLKNETFANRVKIQTDKVESLRQELDRLTNSENINEKAIANKTIELKNAETQLMKYKRESEEVSRELKAQDNIFGRTGAAISDFTEKTKAAGVDLEKLAGTMQKVGAVMMGIGIAAVKMAGTVDQEMAKVATIADTTNISMEELRKGVMDTSNTFNIAAAEVAEGLYNINSSNIDTAHSLEVLKESALLTKTGFTDMGKATDILTTIINSYGVAIEDANLITDQLVITQKLGKLTVDELGSSFGKVAGLASTAQIPLEELLAAIATLTTRGIEASEAVTGLRGIMAAVIKPTAEAKEEAERLGLQFNLAALRAKGFSGFLEDVQRKTRGNDESMAKLFGRIEGINNMFILAGEEGAKLYAENVDEITNSAGTANEMLEKLQTPIERLESAFNTLKNTMIESGNGLAPLVNMLAVFLELVAKVPAKLMTIIAVLGMVTFIVGTTAKSVLGLSTLADGLGKIFGLTVNPTILKAVAIFMALAAAFAIILALIVAIKGNSKELENVADSASKITGSFQKQATDMQTQAVRNVQGSHKSGLGRVPHDRYRTELHENEEVLSANDPRNRNNPNFRGGQGNIYVTVQADDLQEMSDVVRLFEGLRQRQRAGAGRVD
ncbi:phage tail tape measure protein [Tissierella praeacuta]|uniref:phage tail tape measure protein n=1 Tax=Tissierella praeacuta TaxID=43131 RepID=UPI000932C6A4|nr:phage tail tape measure protein [Tissierella praeacuta]